MTDEEFMDWRGVVKCNWLKCAGGMGLAGNGCCSFRGDYHKTICPKFIDEGEYEKRWEEKYKKGDKMAFTGKGHELECETVEARLEKLEGRKEMPEEKVVPQELIEVWVVPQELIEVWNEYVGASNARDSAARGYFKFQVRNAVLLGRIAEEKRSEFWDKIKEIYPELSGKNLTLKVEQKVVHEKS